MPEENDPQQLARRLYWEESQSYQQMATQLNQAGLLNPKGKRWVATTVKKLQEAKPESD